MGSRFRHYDPAMRRILCLNGPNLDRLGTRAPAIYGHQTLDQLHRQIEEWGDALGLEVICEQSNHEGVLIDWLQAADSMAGVIVNPGALTHTSAALADAIAACPTPTVEVHLSNVRNRQRWRRRSYVSGSVVRTIQGRGVEGYRAALRHLDNREAWNAETVRYGPHPDHFVDLRSVDGASAGVILIHGGFWLDAWGGDTVEAWAVDLARRGIPSAVIEYRRLGSGGGAIATTSDVTEAIATAAAALKLTAFAVVGHSSGGHLAAWSAIGGSPTAAVTVTVAGIFDLRNADTTGVGGGNAGRFDPGYVTSPVALAGPTSPIVLVHGDADDVVPPEQSAAYARHLETVGATPSLDLVPGGHFDALDPGSPAWQAVVAHLTDRLL